MRLPKFIVIRPRLDDSTISLAKADKLYDSRLKEFDLVFIIFVWLLSFFIFFNAKLDFSYDYTHYLTYFEVLSNLSFDELLKNMTDKFPYVYLPPSGLFEIGFASLAWFMMALFGKASVSYAVIGSTSITVRIWLLRKMGVRWGWIILTNIYSITLFEANAIRLGCAFTLFLFGVMLALQRRPVVQICIFFLLASLFHLQILFEIFFFMLAFFGQRQLLGSKLRLIISVILIVAFGASSVGIFEQFGLSKLEDYAGVFSKSGGINVVSLLGILIWLSICWHFILMSKSTYSVNISQPDSRVWMAIVFAGMPSLILYVFVTNMGAIGDRFWQIAFMSLVSISFAGVWRGRIRRYQVLLLLALVFVATVNVIFRYPLSNFFYPLASYTLIDSSF